MTPVTRRWETRVFDRWLRRAARDLDDGRRADLVALFADRLDDDGLRRRPLARLLLLARSLTDAAAQPLGSPVSMPAASAALAQPPPHHEAPMMSGVWHDLKYVLRVLAASRGFTAVAVLSLAIGIGANTAIYSVIRVLLLDPMHVRAPEELALLYWHDGGGSLQINQTSSSGTVDPDTGLSLRSNVSYPIYEALLDAAPPGVALTGFNFVRDLSVAFDDRPAVLAGGLVADGRYFDVLAPGMALGRPLGPADDDEAAPLVAVLSHAFWTRALAADADVIGRTIRVSGEPATVVGVTGPAFRGLSRGGFFPQTDVTVPLRAAPRVLPGWRPAEGSLLSADRHFWVRVLARVESGTDPADLALRLTTPLRAHLAPLIEPGERAASAHLLPGARGLDQVRPETRRLLFVLLGVVAVVLLIACVNLAGLMLSRGVARQGELAVRRALGASRMRLIRQMLLEGACLAVAGGLTGLFLTYLGRQVLTSVLTSGLGSAPLSTQPLEVVVDWRLALWTLGLCAVAALLCSLLPAIRLTRLPTVTHLRNRSAGAPPLRLGRWLMAAQIAVSVPLLVGAALLLQTLWNLGRIDIGFDPAGVAFFKVDPASTGAPEDRHPEVYRQLLERLRAVPGITHVTLMENAFMSGIVSNTSVEIDGEQVGLYLNAVGPDFAGTMGLRVVAGRLPDAQDGPGAALVGAVNETAARRLFGSRPPVGQILTVGRRQVEIVGVVADTLYERQRAEVRPILFESALQRPGFRGHHIVLRAAVPPARLERDIREAVAAVSRDIPVTEIRTQAAQINASIVSERVFAQLLTTFGAFALLLAALGLHGVTSYSVSRRRSEIGVRVALGARPGQVLWLILRQVLVLAAAGLAVGTPLALSLPFVPRIATALNDLLYDVQPTNALLLVASAAVMLAVAAAAGLLPARRAARMDPLAALRSD